MKNAREVDKTNKGLRIKRLREEKKLSQAELAKLLNTKRQTISKYENGIVTNIPSDRIEEIARILDTTPEYILGWEPSENGAPAMNDGLSDSTRELIEYVRANIPEEKAALALRLMRSIAESD
ncbi:MAG: helix-turn-helix transcriptional regulator [Clostridia bacterium]|nr:helix-turn-helix transcriptional regulator [Clostridia bacterium]